MDKASVQESTEELGATVVDGGAGGVAALRAPAPAHSPFVQRLREFAHSALFNRVITALILIAGVIVGAQTYSAAVAYFGDLLETLELIIIAAFVFEVALKIAAEGSRPWRWAR